MALFMTSSQLPIGNATSKDVLAGKTFSNSTGVNLVGSMPDNSTRTSNGNVPGISGNTNVPIREALDMVLSNGTDNVVRLAMEPPEGYYPGNNQSFIGRNASELGNATASDVLSGKTFTSENGIKITGSIPTTEAEYATRVGYYSPNGDNGANSYGHVHPPSKYYGNLTNNSWSPEVRLTKQQLFDIVDNVLLPYSCNVYSSNKLATSTDTISTYYDYTYSPSGYSSTIAIFIFALTMNSTSVRNTTTITATINGVAQTLNYIINDDWQISVWCKVRLNSGDKVIMKIDSNKTGTYKRYLISRIQLKARPM
jgi:hypothetical protein